MSIGYALAMIAVAAVCTFATRVAPFLLFNGKKPIPPIIRYLGATLPPAVIALLVVYCLKNVGWVTDTHGVPELLCIVLTAVLHVWKHNNLLHRRRHGGLYGPDSNGVCVTPLRTGESRCFFFLPSVDGKPSADAAVRSFFFTLSRGLISADTAVRRWRRD